MDGRKNKEVKESGDGSKGRKSGVRARLVGRWSAGVDPCLCPISDFNTLPCTPSLPRPWGPHVGDVVGMVVTFFLVFCCFWFVDDDDNDDDEISRPGVSVDQKWKARSPPRETSGGSCDPRVPSPSSPKFVSEQLQCRENHLKDIRVHAGNSLAAP